MNSSITTITLGVGGWIGALYSASLLTDGTPFNVEKITGILSGPLFGGMLVRAIAAAAETIPYSFGRVYSSMFTPVPLTIFAMVFGVYVFAVLGFRAFYEMQVKTVAQMAADEYAADEAEAAAAASANAVPLPDSEAESEADTDVESEADADAIVAETESDTEAAVAEDAQPLSESKAADELGPNANDDATKLADDQNASDSIGLNDSN